MDHDCRFKHPWHKRQPDPLPQQDTAPTSTKIYSNDTQTYQRYISIAAMQKQPSLNITQKVDQQQKQLSFLGRRYAAISSPGSRIQQKDSNKNA
ncbi:hypothetical protein TNCV_2491281 [Trichonephila clavipes]|nr:hypothetical protein TNCV_2491281 [Trichonephila clavipes]